MKVGYLYILSIILILIGSVFWLILGLFPDSAGSTFFNFNNPVNRILYIAIGIAALVTIYLNVYIFIPILGETVIPENILQPSIPENANVEVEIDVPEMYKKSKYIVYWASNPGEEVFNFPDEAYEETKNIGVVPITSDVVKLSLVCPQIYKVWGHSLDRHVHYRFTSVRNIMSPVFTKNINC